MLVVKREKETSASGKNLVWDFSKVYDNIAMFHKISVKCEILIRKLHFLCSGYNKKLSCFLKFSSQ